MIVQLRLHTSAVIFVDLFRAEIMLHSMSEFGKENILLKAGSSEKPAEKRKEFLALHLEIQEKGSADLEKRIRLKKLAAELLEVFPEDREITGILFGYRLFISGETLPPLDEAEWFPGCSGKFNHKYNLIHTWSAIAEADWSISLPMLCELQKKYWDRIFISALSSQDFDYISRFVESLPSGIQYAAMPFPLYEAYGIENEEYGITYLFDSERTLLWKGNAAETGSILSCLFEKNGSKETLLKHHSDLETFKAMVSECKSRKKMKEKDLEKLLSAAETVLKINPTDFSVLASTCSQASRIGKEKVSEVCAAFDISSFNADQLLRFVKGSLISLKSQHIPYPYAVKCLEQALRLSPDSAECLLTYSDVLSFMHLTDESLQMVERGLKAFPERKEFYFRKKILENIIESKSAYKAN